MQRPFTSSASLLKRGASRDAAPPSTPKADVDNPSDLSNLSSAIESAIQKLKNDLSKLLPGGRFNPEVLEGLRVRLAKATKDTVRLGDVAQVVPKGRTVQIVVGEAAVRSPPSRPSNGTHALTILLAAHQARTHRHPILQPLPNPPTRRRRPLNPQHSHPADNRREPDSGHRRGGESGACGDGSD